ncbi:metalloregulator ArsR/SmtB family transcription factor [Streptomyces sp. NPDC048301]|uniref:ArsR/SmtB family transcription factor n=1 Tax=unclassified Streptomyces TaxID=2593676 RepID=UPI003415D470
MTSNDIRVLGDASGEVLERAAVTFGLLASPVRLRILRALAQGESDVTGLTERVGGAPSTISQHLSALKRSGLAGVRRDGRRQVYFINDPVGVTVVRIMVEQLSARSGTWPAPTADLRRSGP